MPDACVSRDAAVLFALHGRTAVVTGACGFLGGVMVEGLLQAGARVVLLSHAAELPACVERLAASFGKERVIAHQVDFYDRAAFDRTLQAVAAAESVDILVNNAYDMGPRTGFNTPEGSLEQSSWEQWARACESGLYWAVRATQIFGAGMKVRRRGSIINIASMYGLVSPHPALYAGTAYLNPPTYSAMKAGLIAFTRYTAAFWGADNVRCNCVAPGPFPNTRSRTDNSVEASDAFLGRVAERTLLRRVGQPEELVGPVVFLASDASSYMTGHVVAVDGGWTAT